MKEWGFGCPRNKLIGCKAPHTRIDRACAQSARNRFASAITVLTVSISVVFLVLCLSFFLSLYSSVREYFERAPFDLEEGLSGVTKIIGSACIKKGLHFTCDVWGIERNLLPGDKLKLSQVLIVLLNNAVKFTPPNGTICFTASELTSLNAQNAAIRFEVTDTGMGIQQERLFTIFDTFIRAEDADAKRQSLFRRRAPFRRIIGCLRESMRCCARITPSIGSLPKSSWNALALRPMWRRMAKRAARSS